MGPNRTEADYGKEHGYPGLNWKGSHSAKGLKHIPGTNTAHGNVPSIIAGIFSTWEIKMKDRQSEKQNQFQKEVEPTGGANFIIPVLSMGFMNYYKSITNK